VSEVATATSHPAAALLSDDPLWFKDAVIYQVHVRAFHDTSGDGIGDFRGLTKRLDYLHDLGVTALWLLPFYPSPLRDDGYDIADFRGVHPDYGTLRDAQRFMREAHRRGLRVITELVVNHTSDQHPWFQRARRAPPGSRWRDFYVWSDTHARYEDARIIFQDFESSNWAWDSVANAYYWHRFYSHQPDLNYESADVRRLVLRTLDYWFNLGVDGLRLDAVPYLFEREGTMCENLPATHEYLRSLRAHVDERFSNRMLLAEANQWPEDAAAYFGDGDECHMAFHFPVMPRLFMAAQMEDRYPIIDILQQTPAIPESSQWALFLRNHDELTLEMVTDEERDYMYRVYAHDRQARVNLGIRRRLAPLLGNNRAKIELLYGLLFSLPGTPIVYYGDEIGMGDNVYLGDRDSVRTPMQWSGDRNAGFSRVNPQQVYLPVVIDPEFHYETVNVETQLANPHSLLWWMRRLIALRTRHKVFGRGSLTFLAPENHKVLAFVRRHEDEVVVVVANLSRFAQAVELDLAEFKGLVPLELFGRTAFPPIGELPYLLTLGPHAFYWLALERPRSEVPGLADGGLPPEVAVSGRWEDLFSTRSRRSLEPSISRFLQRRRWFAGKARSVHDVSVRDVVSVPLPDAEPARIVVVDVEYVEGEPESYVVPLALAVGAASERLLEDAPQTVVARLTRHSEPAVLYDALTDKRFCAALLDGIARRRRFRGAEGTIAGRPTPALRHVLSSSDEPLEPDLFRVEQSNSSVVFGHRLILKLFRRSEEGDNPDLELGLFLAERRFAHAPTVMGSLEYRTASGTSATLAILHDVIPNEGDAWHYTRESVSRFYERVLTEGIGLENGARDEPTILQLVGDELPPVAHATSEAYLRSAELMGRRTAELHNALAAGVDGSAFAPEPFTPLYQRSVYQSLRNLTRRNMRLLRRSLSVLAPLDQAQAERVLSAEAELLERFRTALDERWSGLRIRYHGDFHLGQILHTGKDFVIIDFEGEPARAIGDRKIKRSPLRDVAGMLRSFEYASYAGLFDQVERAAVESQSDAFRALERWGRRWSSWAASSFLRSYLQTADDRYLPHTREELAQVIDVFLLEKAVYELGYELNSRPMWVRIPLAGILGLLGKQP
jgi:maltose alpha-D-glucosyltransferase / alpha-amylase